MPVLLTGCQTLAPFGQTMRTRVAAARQWTGSGIEAVRRGAIGEARDCFAKASSQLPGDHDIIVNVARTHFEEGQYQKAIETMTRAVKLGNEDPELVVELGEFLLADGQTVEARKQVDKALKKDRRLASAWLLKGRVHSAIGEDRVALGDFQRAMGLDDSRTDVQLEVIRSYRRLGDPLRALSAVEKLLENYPDHLQPEAAILEKSHALVQLNQTGSAIETLQKAIVQSDASREVHLALAAISRDKLPQSPSSTSGVDCLAENGTKRVASLKSESIHGR